ncbi:hypothetical protein AB0D04_16310 [Streptomyces sp. NPDC048483]|uniref:hypothetical protein n=1 Tax=Streptomyces sp. NPDC048483 TaxID=3154927 RepID=UPI003415C28A
MTARLVPRLGRRLLALLLPAGGRHRATATPQPAPAPPLGHHRSRLPRHKSPYARDAAENRPLLDTRNSVRPYVLTDTDTDTGIGTDVDTYDLAAA